MNLSKTSRAALAQPANLETVLSEAWHLLSPKDIGDIPRSFVLPKDEQQGGAKKTYAHIRRKIKNTSTHIRREITTLGAVDNSPVIGCVYYCAVVVGGGSYAKQWWWLGQRSRILATDCISVAHLQ